MPVKKRTSARPAAQPAIPNAGDVTLSVGGRDVELTNLGKVYFPELGLTKGDLLRYYAEISPVLLPHIVDRAITMKRYPNGIHGKFFFMKRAPEHRPEWIDTCEITHASAGVVGFPLVQDLPSLLWLVNLGCIDINQWYATCDDPDRPDYLHFDLDPGDGAPFARVREVAVIVRDELRTFGMDPIAKTSGSSGIHIYVPIVRKPLQKEVWTFAKALAKELEKRHPRIITAEFHVAERPKGTVLVDYNQNAWGRTLASVYSVRPNPAAAVSTPVTWEEIEQGFELAEFNIGSVPQRVAEVGDLFAGLLKRTGRFDMSGLEGREGRGTRVSASRPARPSRPSRPRK